ncbi:gamma-glutamylcyclotransferase family protein [Sinorhizobium fredii]|uniref:gamma-glutamylcyclotransferase family protein n=1 Tax=Rhizobium fredii TaxID=380 RepID=UPI001F16BDEC|nr:gamma-glutamylcyclotransferase family protein [Sinorhizobium fredii]
MERPQFVFIFGTLKKGFPLHRRGLAHAAYLGPYRTAANYPMLVAGPWFAPMMFHEPGSGLRVSGELYAIDPALTTRPHGVDRQARQFPAAYSRGAEAARLPLRGFRLLQGKVSRRARPHRISAIL